MRKLFIILFTLLSVTAYAQTDLFNIHNNAAFEINIGGSNINGAKALFNGTEKFDIHDDNFNLDVGIGFCGIYLNLSGYPTKTIMLNGVKYTNATKFTWNLGYMIPIVSWLKVAPLFGSTKYNIELDSGTATVKEFDYGGIAEITIKRFVNIFGVFTKNTVSFGVGISLGNI